jgi:hypothetical protein
MTERCECGATDSVLCTERFQQLLALDHSREAPWGPLHGVAVACYRLQHPSTLHPGEPAVLLRMVDAYRVEGLSGAERIAQDRKRANSHRGRGVRDLGDEPVGTPSAFTFTIDDLAVDGSFPAEGYSERVHAWAEATAAAWRG